MSVSFNSWIWKLVGTLPEIVKQSCQRIWLYIAPACSYVLWYNVFFGNISLLPYFYSVPWGTEFQKDHKCEARGYILVLAWVRSTRVPNSIHHEGWGCKRYKGHSKREKIIRNASHFLKFCPYRYRIKIFCPSGVGEKIETGCNHFQG